MWDLLAAFFTSTAFDTAIILKSIQIPVGGRNMADTPLKDEALPFADLGLATQRAIGLLY